MSKIVTANTLATGHVVFLVAGGQWVGDVAEAETFPDAASAEKSLASADRADILEAFVTERLTDAGGQATMTLRDTIRAFGPTITYRPDQAGRG